MTLCFLSQMLNILGRCHRVQLSAAASRESQTQPKEILSEEGVAFWWLAQVLRLKSGRQHCLSFAHLLFSRNRKWLHGGNSCIQRPSTGHIGCCFQSIVWNMSSPGESTPTLHREGDSCYGHVDLCQAWAEGHCTSFCDAGVFRNPSLSAQPNVHIKKCLVSSWCLSTQSRSSASSCFS